MSVALAYEDVHQFNPYHIYAVTNEGLSEWRELLKGISVSRAAGICSGGEIGFCAILPLVSEELVLVDHSYRSMFFAILKHMILQEKTIKESYVIFQNTQKLTEEYLRLNNILPIKSKITEYEINYYFRGVAKFWKTMPIQYMQKIRSRLNRVKFIHGDLTDLSSYGVFDLLYLSNALQYNGRSGAHPDPKKLQELVKPGGYVMIASSLFGGTRSVEKTIQSLWQLVKTKTYRSGSGAPLSWEQQLWQVPA